MATTQGYIEFIAERLAFADNVRYKKMFGEYMVYINGKPLILVCDETAFVKKLPCLDALMADAERGFPYSGAKEHYILDVENSELTERVIEELDKVTPLPKPKAKKPPKPNAAKSLPAAESSTMRFESVMDEYIMNQPTELQDILRDVREVIRAALPNATEKISYQMPTFWQGRNLIHFAVQTNHLGIYPGAAAMEHFAPRLTDYKTSKGTIRFPYKSFGTEQMKLIAEIAEWCGKKNGKV